MYFFVGERSRFTNWAKVEWSCLPMFSFKKKCHKDILCTRKMYLLTFDMYILGFVLYKLREGFGFCFGFFFYFGQAFGNVLVSSFYLRFPEPQGGLGLL